MCPSKKRKKGENNRQFKGPHMKASNISVFFYTLQICKNLKIWFKFGIIVKIIINNSFKINHEKAYKIQFFVNLCNVNMNT